MSDVMFVAFLNQWIYWLWELILLIFGAVCVAFVAWWLFKIAFFFMVKFA